MDRHFNKLYALLLLISMLVPTAAIASCCVSHDYQMYVGLGLERSFTKGKQTPSQTVANLGLGDPEVGVVALSPGQYQNYMDGKSVLVGFNVRNFGFEFGYTQFDNIYYPVLQFPRLLPTNTPVTGKQSGSNLFLQGIFYQQIYKNLVIKAIFGAGFLTTKYTVIINGTTQTGPLEIMTGQFKAVFRKQNFGTRAGVGLQLNLSRHWSTDFVYMYQSGNQMLEYLQTFRVGLNYYI